MPAFLQLILWLISVGQLGNGSADAPADPSAVVSFG